MKNLYLFLALITVVYISITAFSYNNGAEEITNKSIIKFSHELHAEAGDCESCHTGVAESSSLNVRLLPEKDVCAACHDVEDDENCGMCHYEDVYEPLISKKSELIFDHSYHISKYEMKCESCHKGFSEVEYSFEASQPNPPMAQCFECHNDAAVASNACEACHISTVDLLPDNHKTASFLRTHKFASASESNNCAMCHESDFCQACHVATTGIDESNTAMDFYTPYSPHTYVDGAKQQQITRVHELNYRFSHGIDAKGKVSECQTCHETQTFCNECHGGANQDFALEGVAPLSHASPTFFTFGVGSGGGDHARFARRDIERCASCHDTNGADPNCITCHVDYDGIQGNNPKTHPRDFMRNINGDWHDDMGSVCYNCHTDANARPDGNPNMGFCSYCHGI